MIKNFLDALAVFLSINIICWFGVALYYDIKLIQLYKKNNVEIFFMTYFNMGISLIFIMVFLYIIIGTAIRGFLIDNSSFGAVYIRPIILLNGVQEAISGADKYKRKSLKGW